MDAIKYFEQEPLLHVNMLEGLRLGDAKVVRALPDGVLALNDRMHMLSAQNEETARELCRDVAIEDMLVHQDVLVPFATEELGFTVYMYAHFAAYYGPPMVIPQDGLEMRTLGPEHLTFVGEHYKLPLGDEYLLERLKSGVMVGAFRGDKLLGFAGEHREGAMGLLEVLPEYQRQGVGRHITAYMTNRFIAQGRLPFVSMDVENAASHAMQQNLGFTISDKTVYYCGI